MCVGGIGKAIDLHIKFAKELEVGVSLAGDDLPTDGEPRRGE